MADISKEIQNFLSARKGKNVRGSMVSLAEKVNKESTDARTAAAKSASDAGAAASNASYAVTQANAAAQNANTAAQNIQTKADRGDFTSTIQIGEVTTGEPGSEASASNSGTAKDAVIDLTIPRGYQGVSMRMAGAWTAGTEYVNNTSYIDLVTYNGSTYGCKQSHTASEAILPTNEGYWQVIAKKGATGSVENIDTIPIEFEEAAERGNIETGDTITTVFGKVKKWFASLKQAAFMNVVNNVLQTEPGQAVLDAAVGKYLDEKKFDVSRIVANRNITEPGFAMDGKTLVEWLNELNGKFSVRSRTVVHGTTVEEINTILDNFYNELNNYTISSKAINIGVNDAVLRGGYWDIITSRTNEKYGYQIAMSYYSEFKFRILLSGTWHNWDRFALTSDNIVNTTGTIYISANTAKDFLYSVIQNVRSLFPDVIEKDGGTLIVNTVWADHGYFNGIVTKHGANNILLNLHFNDGRSYTMLYNVTTGNIVYSRISPDTISL